MQVSTYKCMRCREYVRVAPVRVQNDDGETTGVFPSGMACGCRIVYPEDAIPHSEGESIIPDEWREVYEPEAE